MGKDRVGRWCTPVVVTRTAELRAMRRRSAASWRNVTKVIAKAIEPSKRTAASKPDTRRQYPRPREVARRAAAETSRLHRRTEQKGRPKREDKPSEALPTGGTRRKGSSKRDRESTRGRQETRGTTEAGTKSETQSQQNGKTEAAYPKPPGKSGTGREQKSKPSMRRCKERHRARATEKT